MNHSFEVQARLHLADMTGFACGKRNLQRLLPPDCNINIRARALFSLISNHTNHLLMLLQTHQEKYQFFDLPATRV